MSLIWAELWEFLWFWFPRIPQAIVEIMQVINGWWDDEGLLHVDGVRIDGEINTWAKREAH